MGNGLRGSEFRVDTKPRTVGTGPSEVKINGYLVSVKQDE